MGRFHPLNLKDEVPQVYADLMMSTRKRHHHCCLGSFQDWPLVDASDKGFNALDMTLRFW
jgi:hypothetical protein